MKGAMDRMRTAFELFEVGEQLMRSRLRRTQPEWGDDQVEAAIRRWLWERPDAPHGDYPGGPSSRIIGTGT